MFKKSVFVGTLLLTTTSAFAVDLLTLSDDLTASSKKISKLAERIEFGNGGARAERNLKKQLKQLMDTAKEMKSMLGGQGGNGPNPIPGSIPVPPPISIMYTAKCHIDDDPDLSYNQNVVDVRGASIAMVLDDCKMMAKAMYPTKNHSSGIKDLQLQGPVPMGMQTGECHIDDDPDMSFNQIVQGTIVGASIQDIIADCNMIAEDAYGIKGSAGLKIVNSGIQIPMGAVSGVCHIDDDPDMTFNQHVVGTIFGHSIQAISADCEALALSTYGSQGSSGMKDIQR